MAILRILLFAAVATMLSSAAPAQSTPPSDKKMGTLLINGEGFLFSMKEPDGWNCVCDSRASQYGLNAIVFPTVAQSRAHHVQIKVRLNQKSNEDTLQDLKSDMRRYKKQNPSVQFAPLDVAHPVYKTYPKLYQFPDDYYEYVAFLNPGPQNWFTISVWMSKEKVPATREELAAYSELLRSLNVLTSDLHISH